MELDFDRGTATVWPGEEEEFDPRGLRQAVRDAGFVAPEVTLIVAGVLVLREGDRFLEPPDSALSYLLSWEPGAFERLAQGDLLGQRLRLTGDLLTSESNGSASLAVTAWEVADENPASNERAD